MRNPARFKCVVAGRRFGKTWLALLWLLTGKLKEGERRWIVMPTYRQGKLVAMPILKEIIRNIPSVKVNESDLSCTVSGAEIAIKGSEDPSKLRGSHLNKVVLDEYAYMKKGVWEEVIYPMMTTTRGKALFIGTPDGFNNGFYDLFLKGQGGGDTDWKSWQFTSIDGGWIPKDEIERAKKNMDERIFRQEFLASFESASNRVAYNFDRQLHLKGKADESPNFWCGLDFNVSKMVATLAYEYTDSTLHYFAEEVLLNSNTEEMARLLKDRYPKLKYIYPDPAGSARSTTSYRSDHAILKDYGFIVKARKRHPSHRDRINALNRKLKDAEGNVGMTVNPSCLELIKDLEQCQRDMKTGGIDKSDMDRTHALDACSYAIEYKYPVTVNRAYSVQW